MPYTSVILMHKLCEITVYGTGSSIRGGGGCLGVGRDHSGGLHTATDNVLPGLH